MVTRLLLYFKLLINLWQEQSKIMDTVKSKLIQANSDTTSSVGRIAISKDVNKLLDQLNNIAEQTNYNGTALLQKKMGSEASATASSDGLTFQIGESNTDIISTKSIQANVTGYSLTSLKTDASAGANLATISTDGKSVLTNGFTRTMASAHMDRIDAAITQLNGYRGDIGSTQNQVESAVRNLMTQSTNIKAAESIIRDVDYAQESANFNKLNIISQAGSYAISQSNATQQNVLRLLQ